MGAAESKVPEGVSQALEDVEYLQRECAKLDALIQHKALEVQQHLAQRAAAAGGE